MMGSGGEQTEISRRQKETLTATWNLIQESDNPDEQSRAEIRENALLLSEIQLKLRDQAQTLARRVKARQLAATDKDFEAFVENIEKAAEYMGPAGLLLKEQKLTESISPQQKAFRHLRRAETIFRRIEISFGRGGAGGQGGRDLADMFELEMDLEKNQYETGGGSAQQVEREIDEALEKLRELAKRQEKLAERQRVSQAPTFSQRWQQEMLRREAEELRRRLEELQQRQQAAQRNSGQQSGQQSQGQSGQSQQQGGSSHRASRSSNRGSSRGNSRVRGKAREAPAAHDWKVPFVTFNRPPKICRPASRRADSRTAPSAGSRAKPTPVAPSINSKRPSESLPIDAGSRPATLFPTSPSAPLN